MKLSARSAALYSASLAGLLMLSACGKNEPPADNNPPAASTTAAPASTAAAPASTAATPAKAATAAAPAASAPAPAPAATTATATPAPAIAPTAAAATASGPLKVDSVTLGNAVTPDHKITKAKTSFASNEKAIYASVATDGGSTGSTLNAKWSYLEGKGQLVSNISQSIATDGPAVTTFKVQNPNAWPEGKYKVEISLDGKMVASQDFEVKKR
jgi:hypothetical protein